MSTTTNLRRRAQLRHDVRAVLAGAAAAIAAARQYLPASSYLARCADVVSALAEGDVRGAVETLHVIAHDEGCQS